MIKEQIIKNFPTPTNVGICMSEKCAYLDICDKILPGFNKPGSNKCGGPFYKEDNC